MFVEVKALQVLCCFVNNIRRKIKISMSMSKGLYTLIDPFDIVICLTRRSSVEKSIKYMQSNNGPSSRSDPGDLIH